MAYSGDSDLYDVGHISGDSWSFYRERLSVRPPYKLWQTATNWKYNINSAAVDITYSAVRYWAGNNLGIGYTVWLNQGQTYGTTRVDFNLYKGTFWCNAYSYADFSGGGGSLTVWLSRTGTTNFVLSTGCERSNPPFTGVSWDLFWAMYITFERCPNRFKLNSPTISVRSKNQIKGNMNYSGDGVPTVTRKDTRLQKVQSSYAYGYDVVGGWYGQGDHQYFDYTGLTPNTLYELHSFVHSSDYNDTADNGSQEGNSVRTDRYWTLPQSGTASVSTSMKSSTAFNYTISSGGTWYASEKQYRIRYRVSGASSWTTGGWSTTTSSSISGLTSGKTYEVQVQPRAKGGGGDYAEGSWSSSSTVKLGSLWTVSNVTSTGHTTSAINGLVITATGGSPAITEYQIRYKKSSSSSWTEVTSYSSNSKNLTGLSANTTYQVQARVKNSVGWSSWSSTKTFYTSPTAGTASATCVRNNTQNSLNIKVNTSGTYSPAANTYQIRYKLSSASSWTEMTASTNRTQTINNLTAKSTYNIQVRARTNTGVDGTTVWSAWSSNISVQVVKAAVLNKLEYVSNTLDSITIKATYTNNYPNANRIYYALVGVNDPNPGRISNMFVSTTSSPTNITINKDYRGNSLNSATEYKIFVLVNQYKAGSDWYTAGLDLNSNVSYIYAATNVRVGTLSNVSCVRNNTYNSLTIKADKSGNWSMYKGWQMRYKKSSESNYSLWGEVSTGNKTLENLDAGETYNIQVRGSTGTAPDSKTYYSEIYSLTIRVAKRPTLQLAINSITKDKVKITAKITDAGYPEVNKIVWSYSSSSFITTSYTPDTYVQASETNRTTETSLSYTYTLYKQAIYNLKVEGRQYKATTDWFVAGIDNRTAFTLSNIELSLYSSKTDRLKVYDNGKLKQVDKLYHAKNSTSWALDTQKNQSGTDTPILWSFLAPGSFFNINWAGTWFYEGTTENRIDNQVKNNYEIYIPMTDNQRSDISTAYGGNLLPHKVIMDLPTLLNASDNELNIRIDSKFTYKLKSNSISLKLNTNITSESYCYMFSINNLDTIVDKDIIDSMYLEYNVNVIPVSGDNTQVGTPYCQYINRYTNADRRGEFVPNKVNDSKSTYLISMPVRYMLENYNYGLNRIVFFNINQSGVTNTFNQIKTGSIVNISNIGLYYKTLMKGE